MGFSNKNESKSYSFLVELLDIKEAAEGLGVADSTLTLLRVSWTVGSTCSFLRHF